MAFATHMARRSNVRYTDYKMIPSQSAYAPEESSGLSRRRCFGPISDIDCTGFFLGTRALPKCSSSTETARWVDNGNITENCVNSIIGHSRYPTIKNDEKWKYCCVVFLLLSNSFRNRYQCHRTCIVSIVAFIHT